ncbi:MAG: hypothetical protein ACXWEJ_10225 [Actinomycetota bacterium]
MTPDRLRARPRIVEIGGEYASRGTQPETGTSELISLLAAMIILLIALAPWSRWDCRSRRP